MWWKAINQVYCKHANDLFLNFSSVKAEVFLIN